MLFKYIIMNSNIKIFLFCPVPENQKPINEFLQFQENSFFNNFFIKNKKFLNFLFLISFCFFYSLLFSNFILNLLKILLISISFFFFTFFFSTFFRLFLLENRLNQGRLIYEEGSWYEIQIWEKPLLLIKNDRLITTQRLQPIIQEIYKNIIFLFFLLFLLFLIYINYNI